MHILVHHSITYQPWRSDQMVICWISRATKTYLQMSEHMAQVGTICSPCYVDVVDFGKSDDEKPEKLEALVAAVHSAGSSITLAQYLVDKSMESCFSPSWMQCRIGHHGHHLCSSGYRVMRFKSGLCLGRRLVVSQ